MSIRNEASAAGYWRYDFMTGRKDGSVGVACMRLSINEIFFGLIT